MTTGEGRRVSCPACGWFAARVKSNEAEVEVNCANGRCRATLVVQCDKDQVTVRVTEKTKQA